MKRKKGSTLPIILIFLAGLSLLLYPTVSNYVNSLHQTQAIASYDQQLQSLDPEKYRQFWEEAEAYNAQLLHRDDEFHLTDAQLEQYRKVLDISGTGIMAYMEIPCIGVRLPIYHGTEENVLQVAVGHLEWTSLPIGGKSTHSVVSGHRGLPSAELLTNIDRMEMGDAFYIHVLDQVLEYRVDDISVVLPEDAAKLRIVPGEDYVTLVTCTPYGINSHRLLIRGTRVDGGAVVSSGALLLSNELRGVSLIYVIPASLLPLAVAAAAVLLLRRKRSKTETDHA